MFTKLFVDHCDILLICQNFLTNPECRVGQKVWQMLQQLFTLHSKQQLTNNNNAERRHVNKTHNIVGLSFPTSYLISSYKQYNVAWVVVCVWCVCGVCAEPLACCPWPSSCDLVPFVMAVTWCGPLTLHSKHTQKQQQQQQQHKQLASRHASKAHKHKWG